MSLKITDTDLRAAARRHHGGETLTQIAKDMGVAYGTLVSAKRRRAKVWQDAIAVIASQAPPPQTERESEHSQIKTLMNTIADKDAEIQQLRDALRDAEERHRQALRHYSEAVSPY